MKPIPVAIKVIRAMDDGRRHCEVDMLKEARLMFAVDHEHLLPIAVRFILLYKFISFPQFN